MSMAAELDELSQAIDNVMEHSRTTPPHIHPGRMQQVQFPVPQPSYNYYPHQPPPPPPPSPYNYYPQQPPHHHDYPSHSQFPPPSPSHQPVPAPPPPPPHQKKMTTYLGHSREMEFSYDVDGGGREYHHVHDFDIDYKSVGTDFLPFDGLFLSLQHSKERFVAAFLMTNQRDVVAIITRSNSPAVLPHDKKYFVHLNFSSTSGGGGLYLSACENTTFTVRVILAERAGTNFFLMLDGSNYQREYVPIEFANKTPFYSYVHWSGAQQASVACVKNGRLFTPALLTWVPQQHGPPNLLQKTSGGGGGCGEMTGGANRKRDRASPPPPETTAPHVAAAAAAVEEYDPSRPELDSEASMSVAEEAQRMQNLINTPFLPLFEKLGVRRVQRRTVEDNDAAAEYEPVMEQHPTTTTVYSSRR